MKTSLKMQKNWQCSQHHYQYLLYETTSLYCVCVREYISLLQRYSFTEFIYDTLFLDL